VADRRLAGRGDLKLVAPGRAAQAGAHGGHVAGRATEHAVGGHAKGDVAIDGVGRRRRRLVEAIEGQQGRRRTGWRRSGSRSAPAEVSPNRAISRALSPMIIGAGAPPLWASSCSGDRGSTAPSTTAWVQMKLWSSIGATRWSAAFSRSGRTRA
jgi:hypothetical protein